MGKGRFTSEYGVPEENISVIPKPVDINQFFPGKERKETRELLGVENRFVVAYFGRLSNNKGARYLMEAARKVKELGLAKDYFFLFAGGNIIQKDEEHIRALKEINSLPVAYFIQVN